MTLSCPRTHCIEQAGLKTTDVVVNYLIGESGRAGGMEACAGLFLLLRDISTCTQHMVGYSRHMGKELAAPGRGLSGKCHS